MVEHHFPFCNLISFYFILELKELASRHTEEMNKH